MLFLSSTVLKDHYIDCLLKHICMKKQLKEVNFMMLWNTNIIKYN